MQTATQTHPNDNNLHHFLRQHQIDSFNKVWFLLFLWQRSEQSINRAFARMATFSDERTLDEIISELEKAGLLTLQDGKCALRREPAIETGLSAMLTAYEDPVARQHLLSRLYLRTAIRCD